MLQYDFEYNTLLGTTKPKSMVLKYIQIDVRNLNTQLHQWHLLIDQTYVSVYQICEVDLLNLDMYVYKRYETRRTVSVFGFPIFHGLLYATRHSKLQQCALCSITTSNLINLSTSNDVHPQVRSPGTIE